MTLLEPHLDIDQLSAAVDGTRDPAVAAHMLVCLACRQQVDTWRRTLAPLRALPALPADADPVAAAMATWSPGDLEEAEPLRPEVSGPEVSGPEVSGPEVSGPEVSGPEVSGAGPLGVSPAGAERSGAGPFAPSRSQAGLAPRRHRNARLRRLQPPAGVAAALVAVVLVAAAVIGIRAGGSGSSGGSKSTAGAAASRPGVKLSPSKPTALSASAPTSGSVSAPAATPASAEASGRAAGQSPTFAGTTQLAAELRHVVASRPAASVPADTPCWRQARLDAAKVPAVTTTSPTFTETLTLVGVPGQLFVFALTHGHVAVVVRSSTCSLLATVSF